MFEEDGQWWKKKYTCPACGGEVALEVATSGKVPLYFYWVCHGCGEVQGFNCDRPLFLRPKFLTFRDIERALERITR